eukprot:TRINITY_DN61655_c0_g1_i1.p1 TRINITY_DN61655_c0_g1~~TRINITY_DN61655_c0_g1_i1.p1  ORF type:complete len:447 (+),score=39.05 TRINITY_DN61655_c0_g1_i1:17-1357(+)
MVAHWSLLLLVLSFSTESFGCDSLAALPRATNSDSALIYAKNADRFWDESQPLHVEPRKKHPPGSVIRTLSGVTLPQVEETYATMGSQPNWGWGYSMGVNEYNVAIGNEEFPVKDNYVSHLPRLEFTALDRIILERSKTAQEGIVLLSSLISKYGQGPCEGCPSHASYNNLFMLTDKTDVYVLMTVEFQWAYKRYTHNEIVTISNHYIREFDQMSPGAKDFAKRRGWWNGKTPFNFGEVYGKNASSGYYRQLRSSTMLADLLNNKKLTSADMMLVLRDHGNGTNPHAPPVPKPTWDFAPEVCYHDPTVGRAGMTASSMLLDVPSNPTARLPVILHSVLNPCTSIFIPVFFQGEVPKMIQEDQWWYTVRYLQYDVAKHNYTKIQHIRAVWKPIQDYVMNNVYQVATKAQQMNNNGNSTGAASMLTQYMSDVVNKVWAAAKHLNNTDF